MRYGDSLKEFLADAENLDVSVPMMESQMLASALSQLLTNYDFNSWQYAVLTEACERICPTPQEEEPDAL